MIKIDDTLEEILLKPPHAYVYALVDPRDMTVRYIGVTTNPLARFKTHFTNKDLGGAATEDKREWVDELKSLELSPRMFILEKVPIENALHREAFHILQYDKRGAGLLNSECYRRARNAEARKMQVSAPQGETPEQIAAMRRAMSAAADLVFVPID